MNIKPIQLALISCVLAVSQPQSFALAAKSSSVGEGAQMVDVGGHALYMLEMGKGTPAVVFDAGWSDTHEAWSGVQAEIARVTRTVSYDRAGIGRSEVGPAPRSAKQIAAELHTALRILNIDPPYILVGHSAGGAYQTVFAAMYRNEVTSLILVDPASAEFWDYMESTKGWSALSEMDPSLFPKGHHGQMAAQSLTKEQLRESWPIPELPVTIITATQPLGAWPFEDATDMQIWKSTHENLARGNPDVTHIIADNSTHALPITEPTIVVKIVLQEMHQASK